MTVQPPFELRQGGTGIVARNPLFVSGEFVGLAIAVPDESWKPPASSRIIVYVLGGGLLAILHFIIYMLFGGYCKS
mgnify:CR=1 FL=1